MLKHAETLRIFFYCGLLVISNAFMFCVLIHFLSYLTLWAPERSVERPLKCEANMYSYNIPPVSFFDINSTRVNG